MTAHTEHSISKNTTTSATATNDSNNNTIQEQLRRRAAELTLVRPFVETVLQHGRRLVEERREARRQQHGYVDNAAFLTDDERAVMRKQGYYGWAQGIAAGALVFGITLGSFRWSAWRKTLRRKTTTGSSLSSSSSLPQRPSRRFAELDRSQQQSSRSSASQGSKKDRRRSQPDVIAQNQQQQQFSLNIMSDDVMMQLQFMFAGGLGLVVASVVANRTADQARYFRDMAELPLKPGKSRLCHAMCPLLVQQMQELRVQQQDTVQQKWSIQTLLDDPMTPELESITHLVQNCQERIKYQEGLLEKQQQQQSLERDGNDGLVVTIPEPGVSIHYMQVDDDGGLEEEGDNIASTA